MRTKVTHHSHYCNFFLQLHEHVAMKYRKLKASHALLTLILALAIAAPSAQARIEILAPFDEAAFTEAQRRGDVIVVESYAGWCLACKIQAPMLARLRQEPEFRAVHLFKIGEHAPKPVWKRFRLKAYGILVLFRGTSEIGRLAGAKSEAELRNFLRRAGKAADGEQPNS